MSQPKFFVATKLNTDEIFFGCMIDDVFYSCEVGADTLLDIDSLATIALRSTVMKYIEKYTDKHNEVIHQMAKSTAALIQVHNADVIDVHDCTTLYQFNKHLLEY